MSDARNAILGRLRAAIGEIPPALPNEDFGTVSSRGWTPDDKLERLRRSMEAVHTEFLDTRGGDWVTALHRWLIQEGIASLIYGAASKLGAQLAAAWPTEGPALIGYDKTMEDWKAELFAQAGAGITATRGGIAATGSLILWPQADEPRTLSLVPPVHIAVLDVNKLYDTMWQAMTEQGWANDMPTNLLLVSGPSKTADIEQTLAYGVHGPKRVLVLLVEGTE